MKLKDWFSWFAPRFALLTLAMGFVLRIVLLFMPQTVCDFSVLEWLGIFFLGALNDICFAAIALFPAFIVYSLLTPRKYEKPAGYIIAGLLVAAAAYFVFCNDISDEYGGVVPTLVNTLALLFAGCFCLKLFLPRIRDGWRKYCVLATTLLYVICAVLIFVCEIVFWEEFAVRFNFIAVDYLVYTNEVIGNIMESYPIPLMSLGVLAVALGICWLAFRKGNYPSFGLESGRRWLRNLCIYALCLLAGGSFLHFGYRSFVSSDMFATQLQQNGCWDFLEAFASNELDYKQFYPLLDDSEALALQESMCGMKDGKKTVTATVPEQKKNIVLITIESLSADFMGYFGNTGGITPNLDSLYGRSIAFDYLFATGNRTVRGLEAVSACIPPSAGESIVKRPGMGPVFTTGGLLRSMGYSTTYIYGGDSYFDNMEYFFGTNGYDILDKKSYDKSAIIFSNIWGTSDEDTYREAIKLFDREAAAGRPFFAHIMTVSNHRPYTYPEGRISYDGKAMSRSAAVKYTDYAIGDFLAKASEKEWFGNTVFVILADHCASSAGKTSLPMSGYHIPAMIYAPGFAEPQHVSKVCSQIDVMPTLFALLGFSYESEFYGQDILSPDFRERAFMATYQDLGYYADGCLTVLSPVRTVRQFSVSGMPSEDGTPEGWQFSETLLDEAEQRPDLLREAQAYYQVINGKKY